VFIPLLYAISAIYKMKQKRTINILLISLLTALFISCNNDDLKNQVSELEKNLEELQLVNNILQLKTIINEARFDELLIRELTDQDESILLYFENGETYEVSKEIVLEYTIDTINWQLELTLADTTNISAYILGDELTTNEVILNPFNIAPLSSIINLETPVNGKFIIKVVGQDGSSSDIIIEPEYFGKNHSLEIFGLYADYNNEVELTFTNKEGVVRTSTSISIQTEELPAGLPTFDMVKEFDSYDQNTLILVNYIPTHIPFMVDPRGKVRWYSEGFTKTAKFGLQRFKNGNIGFGRAGNGQGSIFEYTLMGKLVKEFSFYPEFENAHHDVYEMSNGNFLVAVNKVGITTIEDHIIEIDRNLGTISNIWDLREILPMDRYTLRKIGDGSDWFHVNAVIHDERDNTIIVSGQTQGLAKVTWDNQLKWILAPHEGWGDEYQDHLLQPIGSDFEWSWGQHAPLILPNGNLLQFDNGFGRAFGNATSTYSRIVEYEISENTNLGGTISQKWQYGKERGEEMFAPVVSDVDFMESTSSMLITAGSTAFDLLYIDSLNQTLTRNIDQIETIIIEINQSKEVLFEMTLHSSEHHGATFRAEKLVAN